MQRLEDADLDEIEANRHQIPPGPRTIVLLLVEEVRRERRKNNLLRAAVELAIKHLSGGAEKFSEREPVAVLQQLQAVIVDADAESVPVRCPRCDAVIKGGPAITSTISCWPILCPSCAAVIPELVLPVKDQGRPEARLTE
jgi:hypothetical protein